MTSKSELTLSLTKDQNKKAKKLSYFRLVQQEFKKISWVSKDKLFLFAKVVLISIFLSGLAIYITDLTVRFVLQTLGAFARMIIG